MFLLTFLVMNIGKTKQELENNVFHAKSIAQKHNYIVRRLDYGAGECFDEQPSFSK